MYNSKNYRNSRKNSKQPEMKTHLQQFNHFLHPTTNKEKIVFQTNLLLNERSIEIVIESPRISITNDKLAEELSTKHTGGSSKN